MKRFLVLISVWIMVSVAFAEPVSQNLTLEDVLHQVDKTNPDLKSSELQRVEAEEGVTIARSALLPHLDLSGVDSWGLAGSSSPVPLQFGGIVASPFRVGLGGDLLGRFTVLDVAGLRAVEEAREDLRAAGEKIREDRANIDRSALELYFQAAELRGEWEAWQELVQDFEPVLAHVKKFVRNGQYSDVQRLLVLHQLENAGVQRDLAETHYRTALARLKNYIGWERGGDCPAIGRLNESALKALTPGGSSPLIARAEAQAVAAEARVSRFSAEHLPKVYSLGSVGLLENTQLVRSKDYSAWIGVTLPIFEGFQISGEVHQARAAADQKQEILASTRLALNDLNLRYDDAIVSARKQLAYLVHEHEQSSNAFRLARQRYFSFVEPLANLIQAMSDLNQVKLQLAQVQAGLLTAEGEQILVNGGSVR